MQFLYPALTIGFFVALAPLLIHLINMMRHRRVKWAAMDFLLSSYKKHRKWVWLKQFILLLMRMAAVALVVAMLAQLVTQRRYEGLFGNTLTHHYILIDDSYSMSDRGGGPSAFETGLQFVKQLAAEAVDQELRQRFTLLRFSRAEMATEDDVTTASGVRVADLNAEDVDGKFSIAVEEICRGMEPTQLASGPEAALQIAGQRMEQNGDENRVVYLVSDFRGNQWDNPTETRQLLRDLENADAKINLVNCVRTHRSNLAITDIRPTEETRAAGVPLFMNVQITNYGTEPQEKIQLQVRTLFYEGSAETGDANTPSIDELPVLQVERINPKESLTVRVQVYFPKAGRHVVEAILPEDSVSNDNRRWCVVEFPEEESVLVVDGDPRGRNGFYVEAIFEPGQRARTGIRPDLRDTAFLRDTNPEALRAYSAIYLFDVDRLDDRAIENLEAYARAGGGIAFFTGPQVNVSFYNEQLFRNGDGLFPVPLGRDDILEMDSLDDASDVQVEDRNHPLFRELVRGQNPIIRMMHVEGFHSTEQDWAPGPDSVTSVLARLRNSQPLVVERPFGKGRVVAVLTSYAPYWNDIVLGPGVLVTLRLQSYLGSAQRLTDEHLVGNPIELRWDSDSYRQDVEILAPSGDPTVPLIIERSAEKRPDEDRILATGIQSAESQLSGIYQVQAHQVDGATDTRRYAVNVDPREGDLTQIATQQLLTNLEPVTAELRFADEYESSAIEQAGFNQSLLLMCLLVALLIGEQLMAYIASFHPARGATR